jgi:hypothetical protein
MKITLEKSASKKVAANLFNLQGGAEPLASVPVWAQPGRLVIGNICKGLLVQVPKLLRLHRFINNQNDVSGLLD